MTTAFGGTPAPLAIEMPAAGAGDAGRFMRIPLTTGTQDFARARRALLDDAPNAYATYEIEIGLRVRRRAGEVDAECGRGCRDRCRHSPFAKLRMLEDELTGT